MPLQWQKVVIPLGGVDTKTDPRLVAPGSMLEVKNGVFNEEGAITKRPGFASVTGGSIDNGSDTVDLVAAGDQLLSICGRKQLTYTGNGSLWLEGVVNGNAASGILKTRRRQIMTPTVRNDATECLVQGDSSYLYVTWGISSSTYGAILDATTLEILRGPEQILSYAPGHYSTVFANSKLYLVASISVGGATVIGDLYEYSLSGGAATVIAQNSQSSALDPGAAIDADATHLVTHGWLTGTTSSQFLQKRAFTDLTTITSSTDVTSTALTEDINIVSVFPTGEVLASDGTNAVLYNSGLSATLGTDATAYVHVAGIMDDGKMLLVTDAGALRTLDTSGTFAATTAPGISSFYAHLTSIKFQGDMVATYRADERSAAAKALVAQLSSYGENISSDDLAGAASYGTSVRSRGTDGKSSKYSYISSERIAAFGGESAFVRQTGTEDAEDLLDVPVAYTAELLKRVKSVGFASGYVTTPGHPKFYTRSIGMYPLGFAAALRNEFNAEAATGGHLANGSTYKWAVMFEWTDTNGRTHRGDVTATASRTIATAGSVNLIRADVRNALDTGTGTLSSGTGRSSAARWVIYRSVADGDILYRESSAGLGGGVGTTYIEVGTETDATIEANEQLYTGGGRVSNATPPSFQDLAAVGDRLFGISSEEPDTVWFTQEEAAGIGPEFSLFLTINVDIGAGGATAIAGMDGRVVVFYERGIATFSGVGPDPTGAGSFSAVQALPSDVGCVEPLSVVSIPQGLMFKSHKGIYLLDRSLQVSYIGAGVEDWNTSDVYRGVLSRDENAALFLLSDESTVLRYDYLVNRWSVFDLGVTTQDIAVADGTIYISTSGDILGQTTDKQDDGTDYDLKIATPWIKLDGLNGYQRIRNVDFIGEADGDCSLEIKVYYDYETTAAQTVNKSFSDNTDDMDLRFKPSRQKCKAVRFEIRDNTKDTDGASFKLSGIECTVGFKGHEHQFSQPKAAT